MRKKNNKNTALITGASSGIGEAFARKLASEDYNLIIIARRKKRLEQLSNELKDSYSIDIEILSADLSKEEDILKVEKRIKEFNNISILINNAGFGTRGDFNDVDIRKSVNMIVVHVITSTRLTKAVLPQMIKRNKGRIINVSTITAGIPNPGYVVYTATKAYLNSFSESLQVEMNEKNFDIKIQALCPGLTKTNFFNTEEFDYLDPETFDERNQLPEEVVEESIASLTKKEVIVIPGSENRRIHSLMVEEKKSWREAAKIVYGDDYI